MAKVIHNQKKAYTRDFMLGDFPIWHQLSLYERDLVIYIKCARLMGDDRPYAKLIKEWLEFNGLLSSSTTQLRFQARLIRLLEYFVEFVKFNNSHAPVIIRDLDEALTMKIDRCANPAAIKMYIDKKLLK